MFFFLLRRNLFSPSTKVEIGPRLLTGPDCSGGVVCRTSKAPEKSRLHCSKMIRFILILDFKKIIGSIFFFFFLVLGSPGTDLLPLSLTHSNLVFDYLSFSSPPLLR